MKCKAPRSLSFKSLYNFAKLKPQKFCSLLVFTFSSLQLFGKKCVRNTWDICECAPHMCDMVPQVEDWGLDQDTQPSCVCAGSPGGTLTILGISCFFLWAVSVWVQYRLGTGLSWTRIQTQAPLCVLDVAHTRTMTVKVCVHSPKHYLNEDMTTWL